MLLTKVAHQSANFQTSALIKIYQICHVIFETKSQFFFKLCITLQCHEKRDNSTVLFHLKLYMLSTKETHQVQIFGLSTARMKINQIPCHFSSHKSVFTYILHHLSVSWHTIYLDFSSWGITLWTKRAHESTNFQIFDCFNESSPNSSCQFWNHSVKVYSNFASMFSVMKDNSSVIFLAQASYTLDNNSPFKWNFQTFEWMGESSLNSSCHIWNHNRFFL